jgi:hypothetical protein
VEKVNSKLWKQKGHVQHSPLFCGTSAYTYLRSQTNDLYLPTEISTKAIKLEIKIASEVAFTLWWQKYHK